MGDALKTTQPASRRQRRESCDVASIAASIGQRVSSAPDPGHRSSASHGISDNPRCTFHRIELRGVDRQVPESDAAVELLNERTHEDLCACRRSQMIRSFLPISS